VFDQFDQIHFHIVEEAAWICTTRRRISRNLLSKLFTL
jgi:hypothetical protein